MFFDRLLYTFPLRLRSLFRKRLVESELDEELHFHLEQKTELYVREGLVVDEARRAALRDMQGLEQRKEECRDTRRVSAVEHLGQDVRYALHTLRVNPGFTAAAVLTLALGIGANTAIFAVVDKVLLQPLPYPGSDRIVQFLVFFANTGVTVPHNFMSMPEFTFWQTRGDTFEDFAAYDLQPTGVNLTDRELPEQLMATHASSGYFRLFGAAFELGRAFSAREDRPGGPNLVVISNALWRQRFAGDPNLLGKAIRLGENAYTVIGVLDASFRPPLPADVWLPLRPDPASSSLAHTYSGAARLRRGVTFEGACAEMKTVYKQFRRTFPEFNASFTIAPFLEIVVGNVRRPLAVLSAAVCFVLLIACANGANLLFARATVRQREISIRAALGAGRRRIVAQLLVESLLLSLAGGSVGFVLGEATLRWLTATNPGKVPRMGVPDSIVVLDWRVLGITLFLSVAAGILFGLLPAFYASRACLTISVNESGARSGTGLPQNKARSILIVTEMASALVLLAGATLLIRTFVALRTVDPGFDTHNVLTVPMSLKESRFASNAGFTQLVRDGERRTGSLAGVAVVATACCLPLEPSPSTPFVIEGRSLPKGGEMHGGAQIRVVSARYFEVFRIALRRGRLFTDRDDAHAPGVMLINEAMAREFWPEGDALRHRVEPILGGGAKHSFLPLQIVGIVADIKDIGLSRNAEATMYVPALQLTDEMTAFVNSHAPLVWLVRTKTDPHSLLPGIQRELRMASGGLPVGRVRSMQEVIANSVARDRFHMAVLSIFAALALLLAATGLYGVIAYAVQQRTHEIGIRIALGARPREVRNMVVFHGARLALAGLVLGLFGAIALTPLMSGLLYGVRAWDPLSYAADCALLMAVALLATYIPARRASRMDPIQTLRWE